MAEVMTSESYSIDELYALPSVFENDHDLMYQFISYQSGTERFNFLKEEGFEPAKLEAAAKRITFQINNTTYSLFDWLNASPAIQRINISTIDLFHKILAASTIDGSNSIQELFRDIDVAHHAAGGTNQSLQNHAQHRHTSHTEASSSNNNGLTLKNALIIGGSLYASKKAFDFFNNAGTFSHKGQAKQAQQDSDLDQSIIENKLAAMAGGSKEENPTFKSINQEKDTNKDTIKDLVSKTTMRYNGKNEEYFIHKDALEKLNFTSISNKGRLGIQMDDHVIISQKPEVKNSSDSQGFNAFNLKGRGSSLRIAKTGELAKSDIMSDPKITQDKRSGNYGDFRKITKDFYMTPDMFKDFDLVCDSVGRKMIIPRTTSKANIGDQVLEKEKEGWKAVKTKTEASMRDAEKSAEVIES